MQTKNKGKIITVTSTKGGVGKTTTVLNLAAAYSTLKKTVLIIDFDVYSGDIAVAVNSNNEKTVFNLVEDLTNNRYEKIEDYIFNYNESISIIASPKDPRLANKIDFKYIPLILDNIVFKYDVILIDTYHVLSKSNIITIDNSDAILYIFTNDTFDLKNSRSFISVIKDTGMENVFVLLNESINLEKNYFSLYDIRNVLKTNIDFTIPKSFHIRNIDKYIMDGEIPALNQKLGLLNGKDGKKFVAMAETLIEDKKEVI